jgi:hypothetical protein
MNALELIEKLKNYPPDTRIVVAGYEGGYEDVDDISEMKIVLNYNTAWYYGKHESASVLHRQKDEQLGLSAVDALWLH